MTELEPMTFNRGDVVPLDGTFEARLDSAERGEKKKYQSEEMEPCLVFKYIIETDQGDVWVWRRNTFSLGKRSNMYKDLCAMVGKKKLEGVISDDEEMRKLIQDCIGERFFVTVEHNEPYNNFVSIAPLPDAMKDLPQAKAPAPIQQEFEDSDIPF